MQGKRADFQRYGSMLRLVAGVSMVLILGSGCPRKPVGPSHDGGADAMVDGHVLGDGGDATSPDAAVVVEEHSAISAGQALPLDLLFVLDNSGSMENEQSVLRAQFNTLVDRLSGIPGGLPDLHVGVVSTDLGAGSYTSLGTCETVGGDRGALGLSSGVDHGQAVIGAGQHYIVDVEPKGCSIDKVPLADGVQCQDNNCTQANCDQAAQGNEQLVLVQDPQTGCPRCRNYEGDIVDVFSGYADFGIDGCGFEQQFEAAMKALDSDNSDNAGFLRDEALLALVWVTDEDDCSASDPDTLFNPDPNLDDMNSPLGPLSSFRCFEFGVQCDINDRTIMGPRTDCQPRDDAQALLYPVSRYSAFFESLKEPEWIVLAAIAGPIPADGTVNVRPDVVGRPTLDFSCLDPVNPSEGGTPAIRIKALVSMFNSPGAMATWAFTSVCSTDYTPVLTGVADKAAGVFGGICMDEPIYGCPVGPSGTACRDCAPSCRVFEVAGRGGAQEKRYAIPWCGALCQDGLCDAASLQPCGDDGSGRCICENGLAPTLVDGVTGCASLHYPEGIPNVSGNDSDLAGLIPPAEPTCQGPDCSEDQAGMIPACWYVTNNSACGSNLSIRVVRAEDPEAGRIIDASCRIIERGEADCDNGIDDDQDCQTDDEDSDCMMD